MSINYVEVFVCWLDRLILKTYISSFIFAYS